MINVSFLTVCQDFRKDKNNTLLINQKSHLNALDKLVFFLRSPWMLIPLVTTGPVKISGFINKIEYDKMLSFPVNLRKMVFLTQNQRS